MSKGVIGTFLGCSGPSQINKKDMGKITTNDNKMGTVVVFFGIYYIGIESSAECFWKQVNIHVYWYLATLAPSQYKDRLIYVWRFPC